MGVQLDDDELDEFLRQGHTLILGTIRRSGEPFLTPLWYVWDNSAIWFQTPSRAAKVAHLRRDPRVCCLVEEGDRWIDLRAVVINGDAVIIDKDAPEAVRFAELMHEKYKAYRFQMTTAPDATKKHYSGSSTLIKVVPRSGETRSWYNRKIRGLENLP